MVNIASRVFFHAKATRDVHVQFPDEDKADGEEGLCGKLNYSMSGTRDAAQNWQQEFAQQLINNGFTVGAASPCVFDHETRGIRTLVHGDDYVSVGMPCQLKWMEERLMKKYQIKTQLLGPKDGHLQELTMMDALPTASSMHTTTSVNALFTTTYTTIQIAHPESPVRVHQVALDNYHNVEEAGMA